jgi:arylsulfatase A-like enzyme
LVAAWAGTSPEGKVSNDLIEFTDFYPTLAQAAGTSLKADDPIDGRSFLPQLTGQPGTPRDWVLTHYQPYWNKQPGQFVRTQNLKLYRDGRFFKVPADLLEKNDLGKTAQEETISKSRKELQNVLDASPPPPMELGDKNTKLRPTYPNWRNLVDPND